MTRQRNQDADGSPCLDVLDLDTGCPSTDIEDDSAALSALQQMRAHIMTTTQAKNRPNFKTMIRRWDYVGLSSEDIHSD
jgi:hypothetical protein